MQERHESPSFVRCTLASVSPAPAAALAFALALVFPSSGLAMPVQGEHLKLIGKFDAGKNPHQIAFSRDGRKAYVAASGSDWVAVVDVASLSVLARHTVGGVPLGVALSPAGDTLLVSHFGAEQISLFRLPAFQVEKTIRTGRGSSLLVPYDSKHLLVSTEQTNQMRVLDPASFQVVKTFSTGKRPFPPSATSDGRLAFVPNYDDETVTVLDLESGSIKSVVQVGLNPSGGALLDSEAYYVVAVRGEDRLGIVQVGSARTVGLLKEGIGESPFSVVPSLDGKLAFINNTASHDISVMSVTQRKVLERVAVGEIPIVMTLHPDGKSLWVSCEGSHEVVVLGIAEVPEETSVTNRTADIDEMGRKEVAELHRFFQDWAKGVLENTDENFRRFTGVMNEGFRIVSPSGRIADLKTITESVRATHGNAKETEIRIWTESEQVRSLGDGLHLVTYEEWQKLGTRTSRRISSAVLRRKEGTPNGFEWMHLHETWLKLPEKEEQPKEN